MIKSMTGFGRSEYSDGKRTIVVEIKSVNHRYCDISVKIPRRYAFAEDKMKNILKESAKRGKMDVSVVVENITEEDTNIKLNTAIAKQYLEKLNELKVAFQMKDDITLAFLSSLPDVMKAIPDIEDEEEIVNTLAIPMRNAAMNLEAMRLTEGAKLAEDLLSRTLILEQYVARVAAKAQALEIAYRDKLQERIKELVGGTIEIPEDRILLEAAIFADKANVTEELVRLGSHIDQLREIIAMSQQPDGKKLDFIVQEMNREVNTIGSKSSGIEITNVVVEMKSEIEKIREQVQNIE